MVAKISVYEQLAGNSPTPQQTTALNGHGYANIKQDATTGEMVTIQGVRISGADRPAGSDSQGNIYFGQGQVQGLPNNIRTVDPQINIFDLELAEPLRNLSLPSPYLASGSTDEHAYLSPVYSAGKWNGSNLWAVGAPYPGSDASKENPCIYISEDGTNFSVPAGITNPIYGPPPAGNYADPMLVFSPDGKTMYCVWVHENNTGALATPGINIYAIVGSKSTDGKTWTTPAQLWGTDVVGSRPDSPSLVWIPQTQTWRLFIFVGAGTGGIKYVESANADPLTGGFGSPVACTAVNPRIHTWWHGHFVATSAGEIVGMLQDNNAAGGVVYIAASNDYGVTFGLKLWSAEGVTAAGGTWYKPTFCLVPNLTGTSLIFYGTRIAHLQAIYNRVAGTAPNNTANYTWNVQKARCSMVQNGPSVVRAIMRDMVSRGVTLPSRAYLYDNFNRTTTAATGLGAASSGQTWTQLTGTTDSWYCNGSNAVIATTNNCKTTINTGANNYHLDLTLSTIGSQFWIMFNMVDASNYWRFGHSGGALSLQKIVAANIALNLQVQQASILIQNGDRIGVTRYGNSITLWLNDKVLDTLDENSYSSATTVGIQGSGAVSPVLDNMSVTLGLF